MEKRKEGINNYNKNVLSKKISKCVRNALKNKMRKGSSIASRPPYGYSSKEVYENGEKIVKLVSSQDETSETVKKIYELYLEGYGCGKIATYLNSKNIPTPSSYIEGFKKSKFGVWSKNTVKAILINEKYAGIMLQYKWKRKEEKIILTSEEERIYGGEFKGIINKDTFLKVQNIMKKRCKEYSTGKSRKEHLFSSILVCNECGGSMCYRKNYSGYKCNNSQTGRGRCTAHSIKEEELKKIVIKEVKEAYKRYKDDCEFYSILYGAVNEQGNIKREIKHLDIMAEKINNKLEDINKDIRSGVIKKEKYNKCNLKLKYKKQKIVNKKEKLESIRYEMEKWEKINSNFLKNAENLLKTKEFSRELIKSLIKKIIVTEKKSIKLKKVKVYLNV